MGGGGVRAAGPSLAPRIDPGVAGRPETPGGLPRKEVIQPHLPVRLPCYDFVPIADPALDGSLPEGLGRRLQASPTFVT
jgi:hypothetical protein